VRAWGDPARSALRARGLPAFDHDFVDSYALERDGKLERCLRLLRELPPGLTEWAVHPAVGGGDWVRSSDYEFLVSPQAAGEIRQAGIHVIDHGALQALWRR
jgi:chitin disaccharide deacetylase